MFIYCLNNPIVNKDENGYVCCSAMDGAAGTSVPQTSSGETTSDHYSVPNVVGSVAGTIIGCVENYTRTAAGYIFCAFSIDLLTGIGISKAQDFIYKKRGIV